METIVVAVGIAIYVWALAVCGWKRRWGWLALGILLPPLGLVGAFLDERDGSGWESASTRLKVALPVVLLGAGLAVGVVRMERPSGEEQAALDRLAPKTEEYASAAATPAPQGERPALSGRIVPVDVGEPEIDEAVYIRLPGELQAGSPKEVAVVVLIDYETKKVGEYEDGADALQDFAYLTIVDLGSGKQYEGKTIAGLEPEFSKFGGGEAEGGVVDKGEIADYLENVSQ